MPSSTKRSGDGDASDDGQHHQHAGHDGHGGHGNGQTKMARTDDYGGGPSSANGKKKISGSTRTGQACDRCKVYLSRV